jgi:acetate kinase
MVSSGANRFRAGDPVSVIVALNCGSSSIKAAVFAGANLERELEIRAENIGAAGARLKIGADERGLDAALDLPGTADRVLEEIQVRLTVAPRAVVHRVVHGGEKFAKPTLLDDRVLTALDDVGALASLHNPPALQMIRRARAVFESAPHYAVFDTAFHATLPRPALEYALPAAVRERYGIRRFGFHGISHEYVMHRAAACLRSTVDHLRIVSCHLGNGASIAAIDRGRCVDTSMGMTPLEGLVMGTRCGDIDPGILLELMRTHDRETLERMLSRESGLRGMTGTNDVRVIEQRARDGDERCVLALDLFTYRVRKYIGAYAATMGGVDAIAFTGGIGENSAAVRQRCTERLDFLGAVLDQALNRSAFEQAHSDVALLSSQHSRVAILAIRADEERAMARTVAKLGA